MDYYKKAQVNQHYAALCLIAAPYMEARPLWITIRRHKQINIMWPYVSAAAHMEAHPLWITIRRHKQINIMRPYV